MDIYLSGKNSKKATVKLRIPVLPQEAITLKTAGSYQEHDIMNLGTVKVANGTELEELNFSSFFPGKQRKDFGFMRGSWQSPSTFDNMIRYWVKNGSDVKVTITGTSINMIMRIDTYESQESGAFGDITYSISFFTARDPQITAIKPKTTSKKTTGTKRTAKKVKTYTVKKGDCLWNIAKKFYGSGAKWTTIYKANKSVIEARAKKAGKKSSSNGHWIYSGTKLSIP